MKANALLLGSHNNILIEWVQDWPFVPLSLINHVKTCKWFYPLTMKRRCNFKITLDVLYKQHSHNQSSKIMGLFGAIWRKVNWKHAVKQCTKELSNHKHLDYFNMLIIPHLGSPYKVTLAMKRPRNFNESLPKLLTVLSSNSWPCGNIC